MRRSPTQPPELPGYRYLRLLGSGGFSDVFLYEQQLPKRQVAVKVLLTDTLTPAGRAAFTAEANVMAQLSAHPSIVSIFGAGVSDDERPYFVMEYASGPSLSDRYKRAPLSAEEALRIGVRLAGAVATAHESGILHRDIKPGNVLTNDFGWPALTDFGIASAIDDDVLPVHTTTGRPTAEATGSSGSGSNASIGMSIPWSPPEMFADEPRPDRRSDVFSLAATVWTLIAGHTPFEIPSGRNGTLDLISRIEEGRLTPLRADVPRSLAAALAKGMAVRPDDRYPSALELARALQRVELELGYAPTGIEVPTQVVAQVESAQEDADATRARSVATIDAQAPAASAPPRDLIGRAPVDADATRVRDVAPVDAQAVPPTSASPATRPGAPAGAADDTVVRAPLVVEPDRRRPAVDAGADDDGAPRSRLPLLILAGAGLVAAAAVVVGVVLLGGSVRQERPQPTPTSTAGGGSAVVSTIPAVEGLVGAPDGTGQTVTFTWSNPDPEEGDEYQWWRTEDPNSPTRTGTPSAQLPTNGLTVCVTVVVVRDGQGGPPSDRCFPE